MSKIIYLGLGSNSGNRKNNIIQAVKLLSLNNRIKVIDISSFYETEPVGYKNQPVFLNCVLKIRTGIAPLLLLSLLKEIEKRLGRVKNIRFGPRNIDLDILMYGNDIIKYKTLIIPHPRMHKRRFVLEPMVEISKRKLHPVYKKTVSSLLKSLTDKSIVKIYNG
ncbi:MAG: 2-amino-4-hydroxy-6-hydroxymethyldihydropteridine diphosphokinase [Candidatus Firestonebacteria bacterium]|nr:2-amino-4-hydroxy-6-hydroxymethyldihydropteridine diphosphokinase [Candidatus Firestonebacteria bacterium]